MTQSHRDLRLDVGVGLIVLQPEVFVAEGEDVLNLGIEMHDRQRMGLARQLLARLVEMVKIEVRIAESVDEFAGFEPRHLRHHFTAWGCTGTGVTGEPGRTFWSPSTI